MGTLRYTLKDHALRVYDLMKVHAVGAGNAATPKGIAKAIYGKITAAAMSERSARSLAWRVVTCIRENWAGVCKKTGGGRKAVKGYYLASCIDDATDYIIEKYKIIWSMKENIDAEVKMFEKEFPDIRGVLKSRVKREIDVQGNLFDV